jgi:hypothetical protein
MRKTFALIAALAAALVTVAAFMAAAAPAQDGDTVIRFLELQNEADDLFSDADRNKRPSFGDSFAGSMMLYEEGSALSKNGQPRGKRIGHAKIMCSFERGESAFCQGTFFLPGGTIQGQSYIKLANNLTVAVVGGTGKYAGARGTFTSKQLRNWKDAKGNYVSVASDAITLLP